MGEFAVQLEQRDAGTIIRLSGDVTVDHTDQLQQRLRAALPDEPQRVVLDVSQLTFICSLGLGALVEYRRALAERGGTLRLAGASPAIADLFRKTRLAELFPMFADAHTALAPPQRD